MRIRTYRIDAVHPIAKRIIKLNLNSDELDKFMKELHGIGYRYEDMEIHILSEVPLIKTDDDILDDEERVIKYLMIFNNWTEDKAREYLEPVFSAMNKAECVFYRP
jgi:hypothetical protein